MALVTDAVAGSGLPEGTPFQLGRIPCRTGPGYALLQDGSALAGSVACAIDGVRGLVTGAGVGLTQAVRAASLTPATVLGRQRDLGSIVPGKRADLVLFDEAFTVHRVWVEGEEVWAREGI